MKKGNLWIFLGVDLVAAMAAATLKRSSREKLDGDRGPSSHPQSAGPASRGEPVQLDPTTGGPVGAGPIRIRNLEDLIRQLEHSSRHMSPSGSEDIRESEAERHFRSVENAQIIFMYN